MVIWLALACAPEHLGPGEEAPSAARVDGDWVLTGPDAGGLFGAAVASGDFDGDGDLDLVAGNPGNGADAGVYAFLADATGHPSKVAAWMGTEASPSALLGQRLAVGDFDGDGLDDVAATSVQAAPSGGGAHGRVDVWHGDEPGVRQFSIRGESYGARLGQGLAAGDLDGDGYDDLAVGAPVAGFVHVFTGSHLGLSPEPRVVLAPIDGAIGLFGWTVTFADLDEDGIEDLAVGEPVFDNALGNDTGRLRVYRGGVALPTAPSWTLTGPVADGHFGGMVVDAGDVDDDGAADLVCGGYFTGAAGRLNHLEATPGGPVMRPEVFTASAGTFGQVELAGVGDANGDGYDDVLVGMAFVDGTGSDNGAVAWWWGGPTLSQGPVLDSEDPGVMLGHGVAAAGDVNDDGLADAWIGAPFAGANGEARLVYGVREPDADGDGDGELTDCDDDDPARSSRHDELPGDLVDEDCDGKIACYQDLDKDSFGAAVTQSADGDCADAQEAAQGGDCDDANKAVNPAADDTVTPRDGIDADCDGVEWCARDTDRDGFGGTNYGESVDFTCTSDGFAQVIGDCDDLRYDVHPSALETPGDGLDSDCDNVDLCYVDADEDGAGAGAATKGTTVDCTGAGESRDAADCDDDDAFVFPGAVDEPVDGADTDCDGQELCYEDADGDGQGTGFVYVLSPALGCVAPGLTAATGDCDDQEPLAQSGASELIGDGIDEDCDGSERCYADHDADGFGTPESVASADLDCLDAGESSNPDDCADGDRAIHPDAPERPGDDVDQDCDGLELCFTDADGDGFGTDEVAATSCDAGELAPTGGDCKDDNAAIHPGAVEVCNGGDDDDCDGEFDEDLIDPVGGAQAVCSNDPAPLFGCATSPTPVTAPAMAAWLALLLLARRRA